MNYGNLVRKFHYGRWAGKRKMIIFAWNNAKTFLQEPA